VQSIMQSEPLLSKKRNESHVNVLLSLIFTFLLTVPFIFRARKFFSHEAAIAVIQNSENSANSQAPAVEKGMQSMSIASQSSSAEPPKLDAGSPAAIDMSWRDISGGIPLDAAAASVAYDWQPAISSYISIWNMVTWEENRPYPIRADTKVDKKNCKNKYSCEDYCMNKENAQPFCKTSDHKCWDTTKTGCWQYFVPSPIWDGAKEWTMVRHIREKDYNDHAFMIFARAKEKEVIYLFGPGGGKGKQIDELCARMDDKGLSLYISKIPADFTVYIFGHSEGSAWAMCMDELMRTNQQPNPRVLLTSGPRMISKRMLDNLKASPRPFLFLQSGLEENGTPWYDLFTFQGYIQKRYSSPPIVSFHCSKNAKLDLANCVVPERVDLAEEMQTRLYPMRVGEIHLFSYYRECLRSCLLTAMQGMKLQPNTIPYVVLE